MATHDHLTGQDHADPSASGSLATAGAAYAAARAALDAALPAGWRRAAVESLPPERAVLADDRTSAA